MPRNTTGPCSGAGYPRGTCGIAIWPKPWRHCWPTLTGRDGPAKSSCGSITRTLGMTAPPVWVIQESGTWVNCLGKAAERKRVQPGMPGSWEALFHQIGPPDFLLPIRGGTLDANGLSDVRLERAIGVIYRPDTERVSHYFEARLSRQFDALIHLDYTRAVEPLDRSAGWETGELPETFPSGY